MSRVEVQAAQAIITDDCRMIPGDFPAFEIAVERVRRVYMDLVSSKIHAQGEGSIMRLTLSVEYERAGR